MPENCKDLMYTLLLRYHALEILTIESKLYPIVEMLIKETGNTYLGSFYDQNKEENSFTMELTSDILDYHSCSFSQFAKIPVVLDYNLELRVNFHLLSHLSPALNQILVYWVAKSIDLTALKDNREDS
jgi:hypothetical protein